MARDISLRLPVTRFEVIKSSSVSIREINFFYNWNGAEEKVVMWGRSLERFWNRVWTELGMRSMSEYLTANLHQLQIIFSLAQRGDLKVTLGRIDQNRRYTIHESFEHRGIEDKILKRIRGVSAKRSSKPKKNTAGFGGIKLRRVF